MLRASVIEKEAIPNMQSELAGSIIAAVRQVCPDRDALRALHEPVFEGREAEYVQDCVRTGWVSSVGSYVDRFEEDLAAVLKVERAVAVVNGTAALEMALRLVGVRRGDEVIMPTLTFVGTANAVTHAGGVPHFIDSDPVTLGLDSAVLRNHLLEVADRDGATVHNRITGRRIAGVLPVHIYGHPVDLDSLARVCSEFELPIVEDAAEALGSLYNGKPAGSFGRIAALSFNGNKIVTTGGGGAVLTNDPELGRLAKHLTTTAKQAHAWRFDHDMVGWNYRLPNINAALGCAQLERLDEFVALKRGLAKRYADTFAGSPRISFVHEPHGSMSNYWLNTVRLDSADELDTVLAEINAAGIATRPTWTLMHRLPMYADAPRSELAVAEDLAARILNIPSGVKVARAGV